MKFLDNLPVATPVFFAGAVLIIIAYLDDAVGFKDAYEALGLLGVACGFIGYVRNQAGRGVRR